MRFIGGISILSKSSDPPAKGCFPLQRPKATPLLHWGSYAKP